MDDREYKLIDEVQDSHWWWLGRERILQTLIEKYIDSPHKLLIADAGCGFGANIPFLHQYGDVVGLELNEAALEEIRNKLGNSTKLIKWKSPQKLEQRFDLILMADVLEHIPDDQEAVEWLCEHLKEGGYALLTVPAHQFFWSEMDDVVHHYRRYEGKAFKELFDKSKFELIKFSFYNFFLFPVKVAFVIFAQSLRSLLPKRKKRSYNDTPPLLINTIFKQILYLEAKLIQHTSLPFGVSIVALFRKK